MASSNPFWFGYYPGDKPLVRRPPKVFPGPQLDFTQVTPEQFAVALDYYLEDVASGVKNTMELPKWLWDQTVDDWKKSFTASAMGYTPSGTSTFEFLGAEGADIPGVNLSINLYDLVKDPHKTLQKFIEKGVAGIDPLRRGEFWDDLDTALTNRLYAGVVKGGGGFIQNALSTSNTDPINFTGQGVYAASKGSSSDDASGSSGTVQMTKDEADVYANVGGNFTGFVMKQKSTSSRGSAYSGLQESFIKAAATELEQKKDTLKSVLGSTTGTNAENYIATFTDEASVVENLGEFSGYLDAAWGVNGALNKKAFTIYTKDKALGLRKKEFDYLRKAVGDPARIGDTGEFGEKITKVETEIQKFRTNIGAKIASVGSVGGITINEKSRYEERLKDFDRRVKPIEDALKKAEHLRRRIYAAAKSGSINRLEMESLIREMTAVSTRLSHQRYGGGVQNQYLMGVSREYFERDASLHQKYFAVTDPSTGKRVMSQGFYSIDPIYRYSKGQYLRQDGGDLIEALIKGDYLEKRYWYGKWRNYTYAFTPGYWTKKVLERTAYFGLVYKASDEPIYFWNKKDEDGDDTTESRIGNFFLRPFTRKHRFNASFSVSYAGASFRSGGRFEGGVYLSRLNKAWVRAGERKLIGTVNPATGEWLSMGTVSTQKRAFIDLLNGDTAAFETATGLKYQMGATTPDFAWAKSGAVLFGRRVLKNRKLVRSLGLELNVSGKIIQNDKNKAILDGFFGKLNKMDVEPATLSPFLGRVGLLNYLSIKLTKIQQLEAKLLAPFISPFIKLREGIKNYAAKLFSKALYALIGTATGGAGALLLKTLGPLLERAFNAAFSRFMKYFSDGVSKAFKALLKGNIDKAVEALAEEAAKMLAWVMACGCSIPVLVMVIVILIFTPIFSAIPAQRRAERSPSGWLVPPPGGTTPGGKFFKNGCNRSVPICGSFKNGMGCHGTNLYWDKSSSPRCSFNIPTVVVHPTGLKGNLVPSSYCYNIDPKGSEYGFAADYGPSCTGEKTVYLPTFDNIKKWKVSASFDSGNGTGFGVYLSNVDCGGPCASSYRLLVLHINGSVRTGTLNVGEAFATLFSGPLGWEPHVHTELRKGSNVVLEPETIL